MMLVGLRLLAVVVGGILLALTAAFDTASAEALLTFEPSSGPCNATVAATGTGFPANAGVQLALGIPNGDTEAAELAVVTTDDNGSFATTFTFPPIACELMERPLPVDRLTVFADQPGKNDDLGIYTRTAYQVVGPALPSTGSLSPSAKLPLELPLLIASLGILLLVVGSATRRRAGN